MYYKTRLEFYEQLLSIFNQKRNMLMTMKQQWLLQLSLLVLSFFRPLTSAQLQLHPDEVVVLRQIAEKIGAILVNSTDDACQSLQLPLATTTSSLQVNRIACNRTVGMYSHITSIHLKNLSLPGTIPMELANLRFLQEIELACNYLNGTLPKQWASMQSLNKISLTSNRLSGEIPTEWGYLNNLSYLGLDANQLFGTIPDELGNLVHLTDLRLSANHFVGSFPKTIANLKNLTDFRISDNSFNGTVPEFIGEWTNLQRLEMYSSGLEGPIPNTIFGLGNLSDLRISDMIGPKFNFPNLSNKKMRILVLRNLNMSGSIPKDIWELSNLHLLDLTYNKLEGEINSTTVYAKFIFLSDNMLTGNIPVSFLSSRGSYIDLSNNNFTPFTVCLTNSKVNIYRSFPWKNNTSGLLSCSTGYSSCQKYYQSFYINCGGHDVTIKNNKYDGDRLAGNGATLNYDRGTNWGFISTGDFMDDGLSNDTRYILSTNHTSFMRFPELYSTARASPLVLTNNGYCLENGNYTVDLHFAEIVFNDEELNNRVGRRIFDIYIQGRLEQKDFNIKEEANGTGKVIIKKFNATVTNNTLEIRLYWAGKGTTYIPSAGTYGPLISAISVCHESLFISESKETSNVPIVVGVVTSVLCVLFIIMGFFCWRCCFGHKNTRERDVKGLDLRTGIFTFRQLRTATNNFDSANKIGEGGFGSVYKGQLSDGTIIAVKQLSSKSSQGNREFVNEIGMISGLHHPHLVKLFGCCVEGNQLLLVYEYMENNCLAHALFGSEASTLKLDWVMRQKICVGIARGLAFLHEGSTLKIVHRDIKATNVLLDRELNAKISDFGLAKLKEEDNTHISTRVAGTIGYMAPEYALWGYLTEKADVYSFGVVALEIVCRRSNASYRAENGCVCLLDWAFDLQQKGNLMEIVDPKLEYEFNKEEAERMIKVALLCCNASPAVRPTMSEVVSMLEARSIIQEVISDPGIYGSDLQLTSLNDHYQQFQGQSSRGSSAPNFSSDKTWHGYSTISAHDLFSINSESMKNLTSAHDLYPVNSETITESMRILTSAHDLYPVNSETISPNLGDSSSVLRHSS